ncbi:MAG: tetratricopeptide repeat protein [Flammeovirgaceae bacterium]
MKNFIIIIIILLFSCSPSKEDKLAEAERLGEAGKYQEALAVLDKIIQENPDYITAHTYKASYLTLLPNGYSKAMDILDSLIKTNPNCGGCYFSKGLLLRDNDKEAIANLTKAIEFDDKDISAWYHRGQKRRTTGDLLGGIEDFSQAIALDSNVIMHLSVLSERAGCWIQLKEYDNAMADIKLALKYNHNDPEAYFMRGMLYFKQGADLEQAERDIKKSMEIGLDSGSSTIAKKMLIDIENSRQFNL